MKGFYFNRTVHIGAVSVHIELTTSMKRAPGQPKIKAWVRAPYRLGEHPYSWINATALVGDAAFTFEVLHRDAERRWNEKRGWFVDERGRDYRKDGAAVENA